MRSINVKHNRNEAQGYGRFGMNVGRCLNQMGIRTEWLDPEARSIPPVSLFLGVGHHVKGRFEEQYTVLFTMWETKCIPMEFREGMRDCELLVVCSRQNQEMFGQYHPNVQFVPLGVDPRQWHYTERTDPEPFRFLTAGEGPRKGVDLSVKAFKIVRDWAVEHGYEAPKLLVRGPGSARDPDITIVGPVSPGDEVALYGLSHCYLAPTRGEGWGLMPSQAIAQGLPTILTDAHGQAEFAHLGLGISAGSSKAEMLLYGEDAGDWWEPNFDELVDQMKDVMERYGYHSWRAKVNAGEWPYTWERTAKELVDVIGDIPETRIINPTWRETVRERYRIVTNSTFEADIGGTTYVFVRGEPTYEGPDVKRVLFDAGRLDPDCVVLGERGFTDTELVEEGLRRARHHRYLGVG